MAGFQPLMLVPVVTLENSYDFVMKRGNVMTSKQASPQTFAVRFQTHVCYCSCTTGCFHMRLQSNK